MEEDIHVVDSGTVAPADDSSSSMVVLTDVDGQQQILHLSNNDQNAEMLLENLPAHLRDESMKIMHQVDDVDYLSHQRAAEVLQSIGEGMTGEGIAGQHIEVDHNQAVVYVEDEIAAALQQAGAANNGDEHSQVIVLEGGSADTVDMSGVADGFQGTLIVIMQQNEEKNMETIDNLQGAQEDSVFIDQKGDHISDQNTVHSTQVFHQPDEGFKENVECKDVSHEPVLEKPYQCKECDKKFAWKRSLTVHQRIHSGKGMFTCQQCGKDYSSKVSLQSHIATHVKQEDKPFSCDVCGKKFTKKWDWETHKWQHTGQKKFICEHCGKTYARNSDLRRHVLSHTGNKPFECRYCGKRFITKWHYNYHERRHTGVKPYQCQLCYKEFMQKCHLDRHEITHASETYSCQYCGRKYMHKDEVTRHERTHIKHSKEMDTSESLAAVGSIESNTDDVVGNVDDALEYLMAFAGQVGIDSLKEKQEIQEKSMPVITTSKCSGCKQKFAGEEELLIHKEVQPNCSGDSPVSDSINCKYCDRIFKYKTSFIKHVTSHAAFHFDEEFEDLKAEIEQRAQVLTTDSSIFVCVNCYHAYSSVEKLKEHKNLCTERVQEKNSDDKDNLKDALLEMSSAICDDDAQADNQSNGEDKVNDIDLLTEKESLNTDTNDLETNKKNQPPPQTKKVIAYDEEGHKVQVILSRLIYVCGYCNSEFKYRTSFERHEEQHEGSKNIKESKSKRPFICTLCGVGFRRPFHLVRHMETHAKRIKTKPVKHACIKTSRLIMETKPCDEIQEIVDIFKENNNLSNENKSEDNAYEEDIQSNNMKNSKSIAEPLLQSKEIKDGFEESSKTEDKLPINSTTRSRRSIRLPKRFRTDGDESTADEVVEKYIKVQERPEENLRTTSLPSVKKQLSNMKRGRPRKINNDMLDQEEIEIHERSSDSKIKQAPPKKRGRPRKVVKETFECKTCKKIFPFKSLLRNHNITKHSIIEFEQSDIATSLSVNKIDCTELSNTNSSTNDLNDVIESELKMILDRSVINGSSNDDQHLETEAKKTNTDSIQDEQSIKILPGTLQEEKKDLSLDKSETHNELQTKDIRTRSKSNEYLCDQCGRKFASQVHVLQHQQFHKKGKSKTTVNQKYNCNQCHKVFKTSTLLKRHQLLHIDKKCFRCLECSKSFRRADDLKRHNKTHSGKRPFRCEVCGKSFAYSFPLKVHLQSHTGARPHMCDVCGKMFSKKFDMEAHLNMHTGNTPHVCKICKKKYARKADLNRHMKKHEGTQPLSCSFCDRKFSTRWHLKYHERTHTGEKPYSCDICNKQFSQLMHLKKHLLLHKKNPTSTSIENSVDKELDDNSLLKTVVEGLQQASQASLETSQDDSQQIIQVLEVEGNNSDEMQIFNLILS
ncbi:uncharacterized protein [Antedon mediterranea]|uniref:uncharacterized protein n=1 Tax=Antedon mediterranea TaxID=105859 RepID=UPI003AF7929D